MDYRIFNERSGVNACDCTWGCTEIKSESALKVKSGKEIPCHTRESNLHQWHTVQCSTITQPFFSLSFLKESLPITSGWYWRLAWILVYSHWKKITFTVRYVFTFKCIILLFLSLLDRLRKKSKITKTLRSRNVSRWLSKQLCWCQTPHANPKSVTLDLYFC